MNYFDTLIPAGNRSVSFSPIMPPSTEQLLNRLRLRQIALLLAIDEHTTLRAAAACLGMTQPAASKMLRELEEAIGTALCERVGEVERNAASYARGAAGTLRIAGKVASDRMKEAAVERLTYTLEGRVFRVELRTSGNASGIPLSGMTSKKEEKRSPKGSSGGCNSGWGLFGLSLFLLAAAGRNRGKRGR